MTVKVIGNARETVHRVECHSCASILEYTRSDVKDGYTHECTPKHYHYVECPVCRERYKDHPSVDELGRVEVKWK